MIPVIEQEKQSLLAFKVVPELRRFSVIIIERNHEVLSKPS